MEYLEKNKIITIALVNTVKDKIKNIFNRNIEEFIEKEFPQDEELKIFIFKYKSKDKNKIGIKINDSDYILFVERSVDNLRNKIDNYMFCFDIQKKPEIIIDENNDFLDIECEIKIPIEFNRKYYNNSTNNLLDTIEKKFEELKPYETQSLEENEEYQKWFVYLTLLEKLIDAKDFYIETQISYSKNKATISVDDNNIFEKLKKARGEDFIFYYPENVNKNKKLHEWDEDRKNSKDNFFGKLDRQFDANKKEFTFTLSDEFKKEFTNNEHSEIISSALDDLNFAMKARQFIEEKVNSTTQVKNHILKLRDHCKLELYKISHKVPFNGTFKHFLIK